MEHYGWSIVDSDGRVVTCVIFATLKEAEKRSTDLRERHGLDCVPVELFIKEKQL